MYQLDGYRVLVGAFLNRKMGRDGFKRKVRVFRARFLNSGQGPLGFGVMARLFRSCENNGFRVLDLGFWVLGF